MRAHITPVTRQLIVVLAVTRGLLLTALPPACADENYAVQRLLTLGDKIGDLQIRADGHFQIGTLNDNGQLAFKTDTPSGDDALIQFSDGKFIPVALPGGDVPGGTRTLDGYVGGPVSMNQSGNIIFHTPVTSGGKIAERAYFWDAKTQQLTLVGTAGVTTFGGLAVTEFGTSTINNRNEIAFVAVTLDKAGKDGMGIVLYDAQGKTEPVVLPGQPLSDGGKLQFSWNAAINDAGVVAFRGANPGDQDFSAYLWEKGIVTPIATLDADAPGGGKITAVHTARPNNANRSVLVALSRSDQPNRAGLYRFADGRLTPLLVPGQAMPDGSQFQSVGVPDAPIRVSVSYANERGEHAFLATVREGGSTQTGAYLLDAEGRPSLILKSGATIEQGRIAAVGNGNGIGLNSKRQIALTIKVVGGRDTLVLLTPTTQP